MNWWRAACSGPRRLQRHGQQQLGVSDTWEWNRTHWAVKDADLFEIAHEAAAPAKLQPTAFTFPTDQPREQDLVAVMMPFDGFDPVYKAIKAGVENAGFRCLRGDDIWDHEHIMNDVISLIWRAEIGDYRLGLHRA